MLVINNTAKIKQQGFLFPCVLNPEFLFYFLMYIQEKNKNKLTYSLSIAAFSCLRTISIEHWAFTFVNYFKNTFVFTIVEDSDEIFPWITD